MLLSKSCIYALRSSVYLAKQDESFYITIKELSDELGIPFHFLTKIFQKLNAADLIDSKKGVNGGVKLSVPSKQITFMDIVVAIDGNNTMDSCALGLPGCGKKIPCPMHDQWSAIKTEMLSTMDTTTLEDITRQKSADPSKNIRNVTDKIKT